MRERETRLSFLLDSFSCFPFLFLCYSICRVFVFFFSPSSPFLFQTTFHIDNTSDSRREGEMRREREKKRVDLVSCWLLFWIPFDTEMITWMECVSQTLLITCHHRVLSWDGKDFSCFKLRNFYMYEVNGSQKKISVVNCLTGVSSIVKILVREGKGFSSLSLSHSGEIMLHSSYTQQIPWDAFESVWDEREVG